MGDQVVFTRFRKTTAFRNRGNRGLIPRGPGSRKFRGETEEVM